MVAHIFKEHGLWLGPTQPADHANPLGYFENNTLKERMKKVHGFDVSGPMPETRSEWRGIVREVIRGQGYAGERWGFKTGVHYWNVWGDFRPIFVKVMRNRDDIVRSYRKFGGVYPRHGDAFIDRGLAALNELSGFEVDADALISGDRGRIAFALNGCGLEYDEDKVNTIVNPELWHAG